MKRFNLQNPQRIAITLAVVSLYVLLFFFFYPNFKEGCAALAVLPVALIAWLGGAQVGLLTGALSFPLNTLLLNLVAMRAEPWKVVFQSGGGPGAVAIVLIGFAVGFLRDQQDDLTKEITQRQQAERDLREGEERYRMLFESTKRQAQELTLLDQ